MIFQDIISKEAIYKGFSRDQKYCVQTASKEKYFLRIAPLDKMERQKALTALLGRLSALDIPMCRPVESGECEDGFYTLFTWIDGTEAETAVPSLSKPAQYALGLQAGKILKRIHTIPAPADQEDWHKRFGRKTDMKIQKYLDCGLRFAGDSEVIAYLTRNRSVLQDRPQTFQHGDYHIGNMMIENEAILLLDFDRFDFGDPWEEFNRIVWCAQSSFEFAAGMVDGYFDFSPPAKFWACLAFYIGSNLLSSVYWAMDFGQSELDVMMRQVQDVLSWYSHFRSIVPDWYVKAEKKLPNSGMGK